MRAQGEKRITLQSRIKFHGITHRDVVVYGIVQAYRHIQLLHRVHQTKNKYKEIKEDSVKSIAERRMRNVKEWRIVTGSQEERPEEVDRISSPSNSVSA